MASNVSAQSTTSWLISRTRGVRAIWLISALARIANQLLLIAVLVCAGMAILEASLSPWIWWILGLSIVKASLRYLEHFAGHWVAFTMLTRMRTEFYDALVPQAPAVAKGNGAAELSERATKDIDRVEVFFAHTVPPAVAAVAVPLVAIVWSWTVLGVRSALIMLTSSILMVAGPALARELSWKSVQKLGEVNARLTVHLGDSIQGAREVAAFGAQSRRTEDAHKLERGADGPLTRIRRMAGIREGMLVAIELATLALLVATPGGTDLFVPLISVLVWIGLWAPLRGVDDFVDGLDDALESTERVRRTIDAEPAVVERTDPATRREISRRNGILRVEGVSFSYPKTGGLSDPAEAVLKEISFEVSPGSWEYLAGVSGSGKSTLAALMARGYDPNQGAVSLNGTDIRDIPLAELRRRIALVVQRPYLLHATLAENLRLSVPEATDQQLRAALRAVDMRDWARESGLGRIIDTDGGNLSGGQIQRIAIARALLIRPQILILDEATSQIDEATSKRVKEGIRQFDPEMTVLEISHQVDRVLPSSFIAVIDDGELVEQGRASELLANSQGYLSRLAAR
ncbi:ABC transporter ATP-binding protein [Actinomycetaceae bacterium MB13-C1-2]|nr:ABC transporter ATP-binding protein [Actinomycetaceae bacterium MB13-C1-2]